MPSEFYHTTLKPFLGRAARFFERITRQIPAGSLTARLAVVTGALEGFFLSQGNVLAAIRGAVLGPLTTLGGDAITSWVQQAEPGTLGYRLRPFLSAATGIGDAIPGMDGSSPVLSGLLGGAIGLLEGLVFHDPNKPLWPQLVQKAAGGGAERLITTWGSEVLGDLARSAPRRKGGTFMEATPWQPGDVVDVPLVEEKLPARGRVLEDHERCLSQANKATAKTVTEWEKIADDKFDEFLKGLGLDNPNPHRIYYMPDRAFYRPFDTENKVCVDIDGTKCIRWMFYKAIATPKDEFIVDAIRAKLRAYSFNEIKGNETLVHRSGFRSKTLVGQRGEGERISRGFDAAVNDFLSALIGSNSFSQHKIREPGAQNLDALCTAMTAAERTQFLRALLNGKRTGSLAPLREFFAPFQDPDLTPVLDDELLAVDLKALLNRLSLKVVDRQQRFEFHAEDRGPGGPEESRA